MYRPAKPFLLLACSHSAIFLLAVALFLSALPTRSLSAPPKTGTFTDTLEFRDGTSMKIKALVPSELPEEKTLGLILGFHPHGGDENSMVNWPSKAFLERQGILDDYVIIGLKSRRPEGYKEHLGDWEKADHAPSFNTFQWALKSYPIDPRRVHLIGWSRGGFMTTRFIWDNLEHFATVTAYAGAHSPGWTKASLGGYPNQDWVKHKWKDGTVNGTWTGDRFDYSMDFSRQSLKDLLSRGLSQTSAPASELLPEFYHVHGDDDYVIDVNLTRCYTRELGKKGIRYIYRELDGVNHAGVFQGEPINMLVNDDVFQWIHATRNKIIPLSKIETDRLNYLKANIREADQSRALQFIKEAGRIGGRQAGGALIPAFESSDAQVRQAAAESALTTSYGPLFTEKLGHLITDKDPAVAQAAIHALGQYAKWRQLDAQTILIKAALEPTVGTATRELVIDELGEMVGLMNLGNLYDDREIILALVKLLDDPELAIRAAAFNTLESASGDSFSYSPEAADRTAGLQGWRRWATQATAPLLSEKFTKKAP